MKLQCPVIKILLPVDGSEEARRAVGFTGSLSTSLGKALTGITMLHVIEGGYISRHMANVDFRTEIIKQSDVFKRIKEEHIAKDLRPFLDEGQRMLKDAGVVFDIEKLILDGDPANEIVRVADEKAVSTIIMARRGGSEKTLPLGSVTSKVVHSARQTVYVVGHKVLKDKTCPVPKILLPVDGSSYSRKAVEHAVCLAVELKASIKKITLMNVINLSLYEKKVREGVVPEDEAKGLLDEAKKILLEAGILEGIITTKNPIGKPADEILKESIEGDYNLIVIGRKGRTAFKDLLLGGVSWAVLQRSEDPTVAVVSSGS